LILLIALAALMFSYLLNKWMLRLLREHAAILGASIIEEILKTLPAYFLNRPILHVHFLFGLGEALYDFASGSRHSGRWAAVLSIISHLVFGAITWLVLSKTGVIYLALASAMVIHGAWNYFIVKGVNKDKKG